MNRHPIIQATLSATAPELLFEGPDGFRLFVAKGTNNSIYSDAVTVRRYDEDDDRPCMFAFDEASYHYVAYVDGVPIACLTATRAADGKLDCEEYYPAPLIKTYRSVTISGCKLKIIPNRGGRTAMRTVIREAWADQLRKNARLDVINATGRLVRIYQKLGYKSAGIRFMHPTLGTDSEVLYCAANPTLKGKLAAVFHGITNPLFDAEVQRFLNSPNDRNEQSNEGTFA